MTINSEPMSFINLKDTYPELPELHKKNLSKNVYHSSLQFCILWLARSSFRSEIFGFVSCMQHCRTTAPISPVHSISVNNK